MSTAVYLAAVRWWVTKRPAQWTVEQHLAQPCVGCRGKEEFELAEAVSKKYGQVNTPD